ncbi:M56 family metallopeptidase [Pedobacter frigiditerrae]|uniref:M56 family metallopeptidase n=1 Tax=Pedobacter frigiditerrae TaxID=2530452 RepID=A0A4R0MVX1_9SPHI|nr:M56 family metallopeptidase [Pedobacter frigiditerrae]TCC90352.1 M56 family metallopeptidase [Pedobacter frigiditerrae]
MDFSFANIPDEIIKAIGNTLIHSLWQGLLLAAFAGLVITFTRKSSSVSRYNLLVSGLVVFCCTIIFTFSSQLENEKLLKLTANDGERTVIVTKTPFLPSVDVSVSENQILGFVNTHLNTIVLIWFVFVLIKTLQLLAGLRGLNELRDKAVLIVEVNLQHKLKALTTKMGIKQTVRIAESAMVKVPMVIGHLKPLILIPVGMLIALPPAAIEAILVHELAHISRKDYLVNLMVSLIEVIFFFNPAVLWLAKLIRTEREHCCDEMVVAQTSSKSDYIEALIACQEYNLSSPNYAMALSGSKNHLLGRVKRMLYKNNQSLNMMEKSLLSICLVAAGFATVAFSNVDKITKIVHQVAKNVNKTSHESVTKTEQEEKTAILNLQQNITAPITANINVIDTTKYKIYKPSEIGNQTSVMIANGDVKTRLLKQDGTLYQVNMKNKRVFSVQVNGLPVPLGQQQKYTALVDSLQSLKTSLPTMDAIQQRLDYLGAKLDYQADSLKKYGSVKNEYQPYKEVYDAHVSIPINVNIPVNMKIDNQRDLSGQILEAILKDGLVSTVKSYKLTATALIVNGKKIPDQAFKAFKDKNIQNIQQGTTVYYNFNTNTTTN